ncbi:MAG: GTP-binding protein [Bacteroides sp.]|nr:GTP-binding protein [Bacteroides sp.]MCM1413983.1 GTP-binding protein [Bacteroides sp.]MCM1471800.1 GTP-binding protein [Bacteroides sp.]
MTNKEIPVLLLTGYLGSGKTTLLNYILGNRQGIKAAVIVNDIGEVNIDASLIQKGGVVGQDQSQDDLVALQNGCICCTLKMDLVEQIADLAATGKFDYIVIEASGICEPGPIAQTICSIPLMDEKYNRGATPKLDCIATVVDALRLRDEFGCGEALQNKDLTDDDIENLIIEQIEFCNVIIINKASEVTPDELRRVTAIIRAIQPLAKIITTDYCRVDLDEIVGTGAFNFEKVATSAAWVRELEGHHDEEEEHEHEHHHDHHHEHDHEHEHEHHHEHGENCTCGHCHHHHGEEGEAEEYGIQTFVYYRRRGFDLNRFDYFVGKQWPSEVIRTKGILYFTSNDDMSYLFEQAGRQKKLTQAGLWYATAPEEELERLMATEPGLMNDWDPKYGDRMVKLVFIGRNMDRKAIEDALDMC